LAKRNLPRIEQKCVVRAVPHLPRRLSKAIPLMLYLAARPVAHHMVVKPGANRPDTAPKVSWWTQACTNPTPTACRGLRTVPPPGFFPGQPFYCIEYVGPWRIREKTSTCWVWSTHRNKSSESCELSRAFAATEKSGAFTGACSYGARDRSERKIARSANGQIRTGQQCPLPGW